MLDVQRVFHTGMCVADIEVAKRQLGGDLNLEWSEVRSFDPLPFWTPERGLEEILVKATYSRQGPHHLELCQGPKGTLYDPEFHPDNRHIGIWVDDLAAEADKLRAANWTVRGASAAPEDGYGVLAYLAPPMPGLVVELVCVSLKPTIDEWINSK
ncbi:MAG: VOC family protein [Spongiibacteraceae bacterium]